MTEIHAETARPVVVGLDGGDDGDRALRYAIEEAQRLDTGVRLVHVLPEMLSYTRTPPMYSVPSPRDIGGHIMKDALKRCHELAPGLYVEGTLTDGHRVADLVQESEDAAAVALGTRAWKASRSFGGSTTVGVAARAHCPVIAVPPSWRSGSAASGRVVVGVDSEGGPVAVLQRAYEAARVRHAELTVVHAWTAPHPYAPAFGAFDSRQWQESMEKWLTDQIDVVRADYPDVPTRVIASYSVDKTALQELAARTDLMVLGRHHRSTPLLHRLGSVAHHALHTGLCPVEIVPVPEGKA